MQIEQHTRIEDAKRKQKVASGSKGSIGNITISKSIINDNDNWVIKEPVIMLSFDIVKREIKYLTILSDWDRTPNILEVNGNKIVLEYVGEEICDDNIPEDYEDQIDEILAGLKRYEVSHNDIQSGNLMVKGGKIYLIDFQWANVVGETLPGDWPLSIGGEMKFITRLTISEDRLNHLKGWHALSQSYYKDGLRFGDGVILDDECSIRKTFMSFESTSNLQIFSNFHKKEFFKYHLSKFNDKSISIFYDYPINNQRKETEMRKLDLNPINILILVEPNEYFNTLDYAIENFNKYDAILTWSDEVLSKCDNAVLFPGTGTWILDRDRQTNDEVVVDLDYIDSFQESDKKFEVSFLRGKKHNNMPGHDIRWEIYDRKDEVKIPTKFFDVLEDTKDGGDLDLSAKRIMWDESMFHLSLENSKHSSYITEKILDAFLTKTIPIYWGAPKIGEYFDEKGFFTFETADEAIEKMNNLTEKDYHDRKKYVDKNYKLALNYGDFFGRFKSWLSDFIKVRGL